MKLVQTENRHMRKSWGCPKTKNRSNWCYGCCVITDGRGECGRLAPQAMLGRTQLAILEHKRREAQVS